MIIYTKWDILNKIKYIPNVAYSPNVILKTVYTVNVSDLTLTMYQI